MKTKTDTHEWKEFKVGELFELHRGTSRVMRELEDGDTPLIAAARYNAGIAGCFNISPEYQNTITISLNGAGCGSTIYHDGPFAITGDAMALVARHDVSRNAKLFIAAIYDAYFTSNYSYADKCSPSKAQNELIKLPATPSGEPDWDYMDSYMSSVLAEEQAYADRLLSHDFAKHEIGTGGGMA